MNGIIEKISGDLLRAGFSDFKNDGSFDVVIELYRTDVPDNPIIKRPGEGSFHRWTGGNWSVITGGPVSKAAKVLEHTAAYVAVLNAQGFPSESNPQSASDIITWMQSKIDSAVTVDDLKAQTKVFLEGLIRAVAALTYGWQIKPD